MKQASRQAGKFLTLLAILGFIGGIFLVSFEIITIAYLFISFGILSLMASAIISTFTK